MHTVWKLLPWMRGSVSVRQQIYKVKLFFGVFWQDFAWSNNLNKTISHTILYQNIRHISKSNDIALN